MQIEVTIKRHGQVVFSNVYPFENEGDAVKAIGDAMTEARRITGGATWDYEIAVKQI